MEDIYYDNSSHKEQTQICVEIIILRLSMTQSYDLILTHGWQNLLHQIITKQLIRNLPSIYDRIPTIRIKNYWFENSTIKDLISIYLCYHLPSFIINLIFIDN